jgi:hypothetical protein
MKKNSRRSFLRKVAVLVSSTTLVGLIQKVGEVEAQQSKGSIPLPEGKTPVLETEPTASALGFHHDANQTDYNLYPDRKKAKKQICMTCAQYTKLNNGWGTCSILTTGVVNGEGWCSAWAKKG